MNQLAKYLGHRSISLKAIVQTHEHTPVRWLYLMVKWSAVTLCGNVFTLVSVTDSVHTTRVHGPCSKWHPCSLSVLVTSVSNTARERRRHSWTRASIWTPVFTARVPSFNLPHGAKKNKTKRVMKKTKKKQQNRDAQKTRMCVNAQRDGRPAEYRLRPLSTPQSLADAHYQSAVQ